MAKVFREAKMTYNGEEYTFSPSNRLLRRIDAGLNPETHLSVIQRMQAASVDAVTSPDAAARFPFAAFAYILSEMLAEAGATIDEDDVRGDIMDDLADNNGEALFPLIEAVAAMVSPPERVAKNSPAPEATGRKTKKTKSRQA